MHLGHKQQALCTPLLVPPSYPEALHVKRHERPLLVKGGIVGEKWPNKFNLTITTSTELVRIFLHAAKLRHGTDGFTSPPKEDMLKIFILLQHSVVTICGTCDDTSHEKTFCIFTLRLFYHYLLHSQCSFAAFVAGIK
jgi:hypothetical protein